MNGREKVAHLVIVILCLIFCWLPFDTAQQAEKKSESTSNKEKILAESSVRKFLGMSKTFNCIITDNQDSINAMDGDKADSFVSSELIKRYSQILTGDLLKEYKRYLETCSLSNDDYWMFFMSLQDISIKMLNLKMSKRACICTVAILCRENYDMNIFTPNLESIVKDYQVANYTQEHFNQEVSKTNIIILRIKRRDQFNLVKVKGKWLIESWDSHIINSSLTLKTNGASNIEN